MDELIKTASVTGTEFEGSINKWIFYRSKIEEKLNEPMHPHGFIITIWLFVSGIIGVILTNAISGWFKHNRCL